MSDKVAKVLDARTFQHELAKLANTIALKAEREATKLMKPSFAAIDIAVMLHQSISIYNLFFYLNAEERRKKDPDWRVAYTVASLPLVRSMIDALYNITVILDKPGPKGYEFRESGFKQTLAALDADERRYGHDPQWAERIAQLRK